MAVFPSGIRMGFVRPGMSLAMGRMMLSKSLHTKHHRFQREFSRSLSMQARTPMANIIQPNGALSCTFTTEVERKEMPEKPLFRLAPSDFAFLWKECKRCFYLKCHGLLYRPRAPFPSIFNKIDLGMKEFFKGKRTESVLPDMPLGEFLCEEDDAWVESEIFDVGKDSLVYIRGKIDCLVLNDDQTYSIIDFKTSEISRYLSMYSRQLHAYGMALEFPSKKSEIVQGVVKHMGLVCYEPQGFGFSKSGVKKSPENKKGTPASASLTGICQYHEVEKNFPSFFLYLTEVVEVLEGEIPNPDPDCSHCNYLRQAEMDGYTKLS